MPHAERLELEGFDEAYRVHCAGAVAFVVLHAVLAGRAFGGIRIRDYPEEEAALADACRLAHAMSRKIVLTGVAGGGGKSVLIAPGPELDRAACVAELGAFIESLGGRYCCGPDLGFTADDDAALRGATRHVACAGMADSSARGVEIAMRAVCPSIESVAIQGLGAIGAPLARSLRASGVRVVATDVRPVEGWELLAPDAIYDERVTVFSPCAGGGVLDAGTIERLRCEVVCGGANNPFATPRDVERLERRGIVYVPDFIANAGAAVVGASTTVGEGELVEARLEAIGGLAADVVERARRERRSPHDVACALADARIAQWRAR